MVFQWELPYNLPIPYLFLLDIFTGIPFKPVKKIQENSLNFTLNPKNKPLKNPWNTLRTQK